MMRTNDSVRRGMTLLEAVVWISIFTLAMLALTTTVLYFYRTSNYAIQQSSATASAQHGMDAMIRTIREAQYAANGAYPVVSIAANDLRFYAYIPSDRLIDQVHLYISGNLLMQGLVKPAGDPAVYTGAESTTTLSENVQNTAQSTSLFSYYDKNGTQVVDLTKFGDVRFVTANVLVDVDTNRSPNALNLRSSAALRNLIGK